MAAKFNKAILQKEEAFATIEALTMLFVMVGLLSHALGSFGVIHTGILNSIHSRTYVWEMMEHRSDPSFHRSTPGISIAGSNIREKLGARFGTVVSERRGDQEVFMATARNLYFGDRNSSTGDAGEHQRLYQMDLNKRSNSSVDSVWIKTMYGICLTAQCGGVQ